MLDDRLTGYWSDDDVYQGAMESADIAFRGDGTGWTYWSRAGGAFEVLRFNWQATAGLQLTIELHEMLWGTWDLAGQAVRHHVREYARRDQRIAATYEVTTGHNAYRAPVTLLLLSRPIVAGTIGDRFAYKRELGQADQDPTINTQPR